MNRAVGLMLLAVLLQWGCAEMSASNKRSNDMVNWSATCAMCGASVSGDYFAVSADKAFGASNR